MDTLVQFLNLFCDALLFYSPKKIHMKLFFALALTLTLSFNLSAQRSAVKQEISESFDNYKESFNYANNCMKVVYECFKSAQSEKNAKEFAREAEKHADKAKEFAETAAKEAAAATTAANENKCSKTSTSMEKVQGAFFGAHQDFNLVSETLAKVALENDMDNITDYLSEAMKVVQEGIKKLNDGAAKINDGIKGMAACEG